MAMNDSEEDITGDIGAAMKAVGKIRQCRALSKNFRNAWGDVEEVCSLFFEHLDLSYRIELTCPILPNLDANIEKLKTVCCRPHSPREFSEPLNLFTAIKKCLTKEQMQWMGSKVYKQKSSDKFYVCVCDKSLFISADDMESLTERCVAVHDTLQARYNEYRKFEQDVQLLLLLYLKRNQLSKQVVPRVFSVLCDILAANFKIENKLNVGFVACGCEDTMDIVFKPTPITSRTYDLMDSMKQTVSTARQELDGPIREILGMKEKVVQMPQQE